MTNIKIILASGSPRRKELLAQAGYDFDVCPSLSDEDLEPMAPSEYVMLLAKKKADEVCNRIIAQDVVRRVKKLPERFVVLGHGIYKWTGHHHLPHKDSDTAGPED